MTPMLSVDADQESAMLVAVRTVAVTLVGAVGDCVSAHAAVETVTLHGSSGCPRRRTRQPRTAYAVPQLSPGLSRQAGSELETLVPLLYTV